MVQRDRLRYRQLVALSLLTAAPLAAASIVEVGGSVKVANPPADISLDLWESGTETRLWAERSFTLGSALALDHVKTGSVTLASDLVPGTLPAGTAISTFMLRADPIAEIEVTLGGYVVFDRPILGVLINRGSLNNTDDLLGLPIKYNHNTNRGVDFSDVPTDSFKISADGTRLDFFFEVGGWTDDIRIVTEIPTPGGIALTGLSVFGCAVRSRRRRR